MKKILLLILLIVLSFHGFSQTPGISYQAVILNPNTKELPGANAQTSILANKNVAIRFTIINESNQQEYQEYHHTNTDAYGMINLLIGRGTRIGAPYFQDILWNGLSKKLKVDIDFSGGGNNFSFLNEQELTFMPQPALGQDSKAILDNTASILAEVGRATNAEATIQADVDANEAARLLADEILQDNIDNLQINLDANTVNIGNLTSAVNDINLEKANLESPSFTGTPLAPTAAAGTNTTQIATTAFVANAIVTAETPDATATVKGKLQLAGDLTGTAAHPTIAEAAISTSKIADGAVTVNKLADGSVTEDKIAASAVTSDKINDGAIVSSKIAESLSLTGTPLAPTAAAGTNTTQIATTAFVTNAIVTSETPDATTTVKGKIQLAGDLTGTAAHPTIAEAAINTSKIADGAVTVNKLADGSVTEDKIAASAVTSDKINDGAIVSSKIAESPSLTGTPLAPTAAVGTNTTQIATTAFVNEAINAISMDEFVDLSTDQTIEGVKTFINDVVVNGITIGRGVGNDGQNTVVGRDALGTGTGTKNTAIGYGALKDYAGTSFDNNTSVGYYNMVRLTTGSGNTSVGAESMLYLLTGSSNTSIGNQSLINTLGNNNIGVGKGSGSTITTGSNNTIIGTDANVLSDDQVNSIAIGFEAVASADNTIQLGNENITLVNTSGSITSGGVITGTSIVKVGGTSSQYLMADGSVSDGPAPVREVADEFSATASQTSFTLAQEPSVNSKVKMYINGIRISNTAYSVSGSTLTYVPANNGGYALSLGDRIQFDYYY
jgi:hypothetical protein